MRRRPARDRAGWTLSPRRRSRESRAAETGDPRRGVLSPVRAGAITKPIFGLYKKVLPQISQTEQEALDAGSIWWDADLFTGKPDWNKLLAYPQVKLTAEEQAFLDGPVEEACAMANDWEITHERHDLPPRLWQYLKDKGFFGMIIPKRYGGLGFSAFAHSEVVTKLSSRCNALAVTVMVPNSLGPAELLELHHDEHHAAYVKGCNDTLDKLAKSRRRNEFAEINQLEKNLAFVGLESGTLHFLAQSSRVATVALFVVLLLAVSYLGWRTGRLTPAAA